MSFFFIKLYGLSSNFSHISVNSPPLVRKIKIGIAFPFVEYRFFRKLFDHEINEVARTIYTKMKVVEDR